MKKKSLQRTSFCLVVPVYNESKNIEVFCEKTISLLQCEYKKSFSILFINDGSTDDSNEYLYAMSKKFKHVNIIHLARNFGQDTAIFAGLDYANADLIGIMDCDNQDPPEILLKLLKKIMSEDIDIVLAQRLSREGETKISLFLSLTFYKIFSFIANINLPQNTGYFRLMKEKVKDQVIRLREYDRYLPAMIAWVGFKSTVVKYHRKPRLSGTGESYIKKIILALDAFTSFSITPLRIASLMSILMLIMSTCIGIYAIISKFYYGAAAGWASLICVILFVGSLNSILLGIIGEYIGRIYMQTKNRPLYIIREENISTTKNNQ